MTLLSIENLTVRRGLCPVVEDVSLTVQEGEFVGLIGPNGAGKSSTLAMVSGLLAPDAGQISLGGQSLAADRHARANRLQISMNLALGSALAFLVGQMLDVTLFDKLRRSAWWRAPVSGRGWR